MLAFIFAIGMAFATTDIKEEPKVGTFDYVQVNGTWVEISEQSCEGTAKNCQVRNGVGGPLYNVYDEMDISTLKRAPANYEPAVIHL